jgi:UDP-N-acetyl-2-amino-2-deoxyglucuronate dehydrogenase
LKYTMALIGCGRISYKHIEAIAANADRLELMAVCDPVTKLAEAKKAEYYEKTGWDHEVAVYEDHAELLATSKPDFVAIATESGIHAQITLDAIAAGCHVLTENPCPFPPPTQPG